MTKIFVVVLNWNRDKDTIECLKSVNKLSTSGNQLSVIIVDNASSDDSVNKISTFIKNKPESELVINKQNLGYSGGMNVGIRHALKRGANYIVVLNNDTILDKKLLVAFLKTAKKHKRTGAICPKIYFAKGFEFHKKRYKKSNLGKVIWFAGGKIDWANVYAENRGVDEVDKGQFDKVEETDFATGNCMFLNAEALKEVGLFREDYFMYLEDVDLCVRFKKAGWKILYTPKAKLWHKVAQSSRIGSDLNDYFITRNRMIFGIKYAPLRARIALIRQSVRILLNGRKWERIGIKDYYLGRLGKGSWKNGQKK
jgi:GT2 family glycosyltransferase